MPSDSILLVGASAAVCALVMVPIKAWLRHARLLDHPNERSSHTLPTIRGGGLAIVAVLLIEFLRLAPTVPGMALGAALPLAVLAGVSFFDDLRTLGVRVRLAAQGTATLAVLLWLFWFHYPALDLGRFWALWFIVSAIGMIGYTNAFNFMDGINGLAGFQAFLTAVGSVLVGRAAGLPLAHPALAIGLTLAGAAAGFLPYNFPVARVFMGDVGSASIGFTLALMAIWTARDAGWWLLLPFACLHANFILDTALTMARRTAGGEVPYQAHREHFYQRLVRSGWSHVQVTGTEALIQGLVVLVLIWAVRGGLPWCLLAAGLICTIWGGFFVLAEATFRRHSRARDLRRP